LIPVEEKGVRIAVIEVPKVGDHFREINGHAYVRGEKGNRLLTPHEIVEFAYVKGFKHADRELVTVDFDRLDTDMFRIWRKARGIAEETVERVLVNVGLAAKDEEGVVRPTRASVMLFADYPTDLMETKCAVRVFQYDSHIKHFKGDTYNYVGVPKTINAPTLRAIEQAQEYVLTLLRKGIKVGSGFTTTYQVPERAVKEAITNAVIHRDYHTKRDVEVHIFEDRIEIESPGLLPFNITPGNIGYVRATGYRNDLLVKHLREFPDAPNLDQNEGVRKMRESMLEEKLYPPIFITYPHLQDGVRVILLNESAPTEWDKVIQYLEEHKAINNAGARKLLGMADTSAVSRLLTRWTAQGLLVKVSPQSSSKRFTMYRLPTQKERLLFATSPNK
jgi:ATP-dependent DNA helicase RecG